RSSPEPRCGSARIERRASWATRSRWTAATRSSSASARAIVAQRGDCIVVVAEPVAQDALGVLAEGGGQRRLALADAVDAERAREHLCCRAVAVGVDFLRCAPVH